MIRKTVSGYVVYSKSGKNLSSPYKTKDGEEPKIIEENIKVYK